MSGCFLTPDLRTFENGWHGAHAANKTGRWPFFFKTSAILERGISRITWFGSRAVQIPGTTVYSPPVDSSQVPPAS